MQRQMRLGLSVSGARSLRRTIEIADSAKWDFLYFGGPDATITVAALAAVTERIGLVAAVSTRALHPYNVARRLATLDHMSGGRFGWHPQENDDRAVEFIEVVHGLFASWDEGAFLRDKASGLYFDRSKVHFLDHAGAHFRVRGPLDVDRPPQGRPPMIVFGSAPCGPDAIRIMPAPPLAGPPGRIADTLEDLLSAGQAEGFLVPDSAEEFVDAVIPELQERGLYRRDCAGRTLRENLGL